MICNFFHSILNIAHALSLIQQDRNRIFQLLSSKQAFFDNVTHELKTPLTTIQGYAQLIQDNGTTDPPPSCTLPTEYPYGSLEDQINDANSIYNYYRQAIAIRNALPVISLGRITAETALNVGCVSAIRKTWGEESCIILMNISPEAATVDLTAYADHHLAATLTADGNEAALENDILNLPAYGVAVLIPGR